ncbi:cytochrome P450 monooxygenase [Coccidioides immitis RS]|uniref:Cytochrome P450 monooxygenase n=2 Tax=Coccidioides immitis TaxID=5501 RepID=J3KAK8_COCIM|nr:cytochrome P450 monooxygenase [Coccidioides immitis RS]EAS32065.3 cytochrome P450 monooxygenase [Coccidioides immitis RS]KMP07256.1 ent-kaurene oxidase [Coccidioides immitis RMSCC 2394]
MFSLDPVFLNNAHILFHNALFTLSSNKPAIFVISAAVLLLWRLLKDILFSVKAPYVGYESSWEPTWLISRRFSREAPGLIEYGYQRYRDSIYKLSRRDSDILVIPHKFVDELRSLPEEHICAMEAHIQTLLGPITGTDILLDGDLHTKVLQTKLTPNLGHLIGPLKEELEFAMSMELPDCKDEWVEIQMHGIIRRFVARLSARAFTGPIACRNEEWVAANTAYPTNIFTTIGPLRMFPSFMRSSVAPFLSSYWRIRSNIATAKRVIVPIINQRRRDEASGDPNYEKPKDLLQWMLDTAKPKDAAPASLAHRLLALSLGSLNTTTTAAVQTLYDICNHPEYFEPLREELLDSLTANGGWDKATLSKLHGFDSFMKESQRVNPPSYLSFNRVVRKPLTLSDGTRFPKGTHFGMPAYSILQDPSIVENPTEFDGFRYKKIRQQPKEANKHQYASTDSNNIHFGHGKYACPGRFYASHVVKLIVGHLILEYDFKFPEGKCRPQNLNIDENVYPDPSATLLIRRRQMA